VCGCHLHVGHAAYNACSFKACLLSVAGAGYEACYSRLDTAVGQQSRRGPEVQVSTTVVPARAQPGTDSPSTKHWRGCLRAPTIVMQHDLRLHSLVYVAANIRDEKVWFQHRCLLC
jgi:hypothetical protein